METALLNEKIIKLPIDAQKEINDFIEFVYLKYSTKKDKKKKFNFKWEGALSEYKEKYNSVELQKKSNEWRNI